MKFLIGFILSAPIWFAFLITVNSFYSKAINYFGTDIRIGYWLGVAIAGFAAAVFMWGK